MCRQQGNYEMAVKYYEWALRIKEEAVPNSNDLADTLYNLALVYRKMGKHTESHTHFHRAAQMLEALHGRDDDNTLDAYRQADKARMLVDRPQSQLGADIVQTSIDDTVITVLDTSV